MKGTIWCWLFGHKFISVVKDIPTGLYSSIQVVRPSSFCVRCGLSKKETSKGATRKMKRKKNRCDDCGTELEKVFIYSEFNIPVMAWVCPKSETYQEYLKNYKKKYFKKEKGK